MKDMTCLNFQILIILGFSFVDMSKLYKLKSGDVIEFSLLRLQGARDLAKPPTLTEIFQSNLKNSDSKEVESEKQETGAELKQGMKRKFDHSHSSEDSEDDSQKANEQQSLKDGKLKKAKNVGSRFSPVSLLKY
jgi:hypothetical protein